MGVAPVLEEHRDRTDGSLTTERDKTDESILVLQTKTEHATDERVKRGRAQSDLARDRDRRAADADIESIRETADPATFRAELAGERAIDDRLAQQRADADAVVLKERTQVDTAIQLERALRQAETNALLARERGETDDNLQSERAQTDDEVRRSTTRLDKELSSHTKTKLALTTRDEFLAIVSHDLRNPIGAILSCAELMLDDLSEPADPEQLRLSIELVKRNAETSLRLISDLLDIERIVAGKLTIEMRPYDVCAVITQSIESFSYAAAAKGIRLETKFAPPCALTFDRDRVAQVLSNLLGNALKYTPKGGTIVVATAVADGELLVSVSDSGPGIPETERLKIFDRFAQLGNKDREGLGLGLYISKMLIEAHRGRLWVDSKRGAGSTFTFALPSNKRSDSLRPLDL